MDVTNNFLASLQILDNPNCFTADGKQNIGIKDGQIVENTENIRRKYLYTRADRNLNHIADLLNKNWETINKTIQESPNNKQRIINIATIAKLSGTFEHTEEIETYRLLNEFKELGFSEDDTTHLNDLFNHPNFSQYAKEANLTKIELGELLLSVFKFKVERGQVTNQTHLVLVLKEIFENQATYGTHVRDHLFNTQNTDLKRNFIAELNPVNMQRVLFEMKKPDRINHLLNLGFNENEAIEFMNQFNAESFATMLTYQQQNNLDLTKDEFIDHMFNGLSIFLDDKSLYHLEIKEKLPTLLTLIKNKLIKNNSESSLHFFLFAPQKPENQDIWRKTVLYSLEKGNESHSFRNYWNIILSSPQYQNRDRVNVQDNVLNVLDYLGEHISLYSAIVMLESTFSRADLTKPEILETIQKRYQPTTTNKEIAALSPEVKNSILINLSKLPEQVTKDIMFMLEEKTVDLSNMNDLISAFAYKSPIPNLTTYIPMIKDLVVLLLTGDDSDIRKQNVMAIWQLLHLFKGNIDSLETDEQKKDWENDMKAFFKFVTDVTVRYENKEFDFDYFATLLNKNNIIEINYKKQNYEEGYIKDVNSNTLKAFLNNEEKIQQFQDDWESHLDKKFPSNVKSARKI